MHLYKIRDVLHIQLPRALLDLARAVTGYDEGDVVHALLRLPAAKLATLEQLTVSDDCDEERAAELLAQWIGRRQAA